MPIEGELTDIGLTSVVQMLCMERRRAAVRLRRRGEEGTIYIQKGEVVHAALGSLKGEEAVYQLLTWSDGSFRISDPVGLPPKTIGMSWNHLLLEGSRKFDEKRRDDSRTMVRSAIHTKLNIEFDHQLLSDLVAFLSTEERLLDRLKSKKVTKKPLLALSILEELINNVVLFSEQVPKADLSSCSLLGAITQVSDTYPQIRLAHVQNNRLSLTTATNLYRSWANDPADRNHIFHQLCRGLIAAMESYFVLLASHLPLPESSEEWRELYTVFVLDLTKAVEAVKF